MADLRYKRRVYDHTGKLQRVELYDPVQLVGTPDNFDHMGMFVNADARLSILPAYREQTVKAVYQADSNIIPMGTFPDNAFAAGRPVYWLGDADVRKAASGKDFDSCMAFRGRAALSLEKAKFVQSPDVLLRSESGMEIDFTFDFRMRPKPGVYRPEILIHFVIQCGGRYLSAETLEWQAGFVANSALVKREDYDTWNTYKMICPGPPADGMFAVRFYESVVQASEDVPNPSKAVGYLELDNIAARLMYNGYPPIMESTRTEPNSKQYSLVPPVAEITHADTPEYLNAELIYPYAWRVNGQLTRRWSRYGYNESERLIDLVLDTLVDAAGRPTRHITGTIRAPFLIQPHHYIRITYDQNRVYKINALSWDVRAGEYEVELLEVVDDATIRPKYLLQEDGNIIMTEGNRPVLLEERR